MATIIIDEDWDLTVEVTEYDKKARDGHGNKLVAQKQQFRVRTGVLTEHSTTLAAKVRPSHPTEAQKEFITLYDDSVASMDVWFRILHQSDLNYDVPLEEMWRLVAACDKYRFKLSMLKPWFATWYQTHDINQYYRNWDISRHRVNQYYANWDISSNNTVRLTPRSLLYPCWVFDHSQGFMRATRFLCYESVGHITECNPTDHDNLRLENRIIQQLNAARGRLRTVIHAELFRPNEMLLKANCNCKEVTLFDYEKELYRIDVWPLERIHQKNSMATILDRLGKFSYEAKKLACVLYCQKNYKKIVKDAHDKTKTYFDGLCLDCMDQSNPVTGNANTDYWRHSSLKVSDFSRRCRSKHQQPTWYFSFMGRRDRMERFQRDLRASKYDSESD